MMRELVRTTEPVLLSFVEALLNDAGLTCMIADTHISVMEGSIGVFPRRVLVLDEDYARARRLLIDAGLERELSTRNDRA
jgi:hypothetical protein